MTSWTIAQQAPLSTGFSGQGYWSGLPFPPAGTAPEVGLYLCGHVVELEALNCFCGYGSLRPASM